MRRALLSTSKVFKKTIRGFAIQVIESRCRSIKETRELRYYRTKASSRLCKYIKMFSWANLIMTSNRQLSWGHVDFIHVEKISHTNDEAGVVSTGKGLQNWVFILTL